MRRLPFSLNPVLIFRYLTDALFHRFRTHSSDLPAPIVVDHGGYFGGASDMLICGESMHIRLSTYWSRLLNWPCNAFDFGHLTGIEYTMIMVWSFIGTRVLKRFLPIGYTTVCCSHVECEHQFAPRTVIYCSCRHARRQKRLVLVVENPGRQEWHGKAVVTVRQVVWPWGSTTRLQLAVAVADECRWCLTSFCGWSDVRLD